VDIVKTIFRLLYGQRLPITDGTLHVMDIDSAVTIKRDAYGIPYIESASEMGAWYGLGFCHGQDRAFQIELYLRIARGTMAELIGKDVLSIDRISRRVGFLRAAQEQFPLLDEHCRTLLESYALGVTDGSRLGCRREAHEFSLLQSHPSIYKPEDALAVIKLMSFLMATNWDNELTRLKILTEDGVDALKALDDSYPEYFPVTSPPGKLARRALTCLEEDLYIFLNAIPRGGGSNNWVIAPSRTSTGRPILANDPHLPPAVPPYWYLAHMRTPEWTVAGATYPGIPTMPVGHNGTAAWGITVGTIDNTDLFIEEVGDDGCSVRMDDHFIPCEVVKETILIKDADSVVEEVLITPRGPIIGPALEGEPGTLSIRATWLDPKPISGLFHFQKVQTFEDLRKSLVNWPLSSYHIVYADVSGSIGWQLAGDAPRRRSGWGTIPLPGWDPDTGWEEETIPFEQLPHLHNPSSGFIATANNPPAPEEKGPFLGADSLDGFRLERISDVLASRKDWDFASAQALQMDLQSIPWHELRDVLLNLPGNNQAVRQALDLLKAWDGVLGAGSVAGTIFECFLMEMVRRVVTAKAPRSIQWALGKGYTQVAPYNSVMIRQIGRLVNLLIKQPDGWFADSWQAQMTASLSTVMGDLRRRFGAQPARWAWGSVRKLYMRPLDGKRGPLDPVFRLGPITIGGDSNTISPAGLDPFDPLANPTDITTLRMVLDVGNWEVNSFSLSGGQSGNPLSPHYADMLPLWQDGKGVSIAWSQLKVEEITKSVLRLEPK
jgi:penicillin amidase